MICKLILNSQKIYSGVSIGNGAFDQDIMATTRYEYPYYQGLIGLEQWDRLRSICCRTKANSLDLECDFPHLWQNATFRVRNGNHKCYDTLNETLPMAIADRPLDIYYLYEKCNASGMVNNASTVPNSVSILAL